MKRHTLFLAASWAALSAAQAAGDDDIAQNRDVMVVTATRTATAAERLPERVDVISRDDIEIEGLQTLADALALTPGVHVEQSGPAGTTASLFIRGTNSSHTLMLFDGVRLNDPAAPSGQFDFGQDTLADAERVEIVRGPLSSLYGSDAIGGVVNVIPRRGGERAFEPYYEASAGSFETYRGLVGATGATDRARYGASLEHFQTGGFDMIPERMSTRTGEAEAARSTTFTASGELDIGGGFTLEGLARHRVSQNEFDTFSGGPSGFQRADDPDLETPRDDLTLWRGGLAYTRGGVESRLRAGQVLRDRENADGGMVTDTFAGDRAFAEWLNVWRPEAGGLAPALTFGVQYEHDAVETMTAFADPVDETEDRLGAYVGAAVRLADRIELQGSARVDDHEGFGAETTVGLGGVFDIREIGTQLTAAYGTSFRAPSLTERFATSFFNVGNPDLRPESGESWEAGFRTALGAFGRDDGLSFGAVYFSSEIDDLIEYDFAALQNVNVGRAEIDGYEAWIEAAPSDRVAARLSYAHTDARNALTGDRLLRRPPHAWTASIHAEPIDRVTLAARWTRVGSRPDVNYDDDGFFLGSGGSVDGYDLVSVSGAFAVSDAVELFASASNLFDEVHERPEAFSGAPRALTIGVRGRF